jgi:hypothetical protein
MVGKLKQLTPIDSTQIQIFYTHLTQKWCIILGLSILMHSIKFIMFKFMWMKTHETLIFDQLSTFNCNNTCSNGSIILKCSKNVTTIVFWWWWFNFTSSSINKSLCD